MEKGCISICKKKKKEIRIFLKKKNHTLKKQSTEQLPHDLPPRPIHHGLCLHSYCCIGSAPWCSTTPSPMPGSKGSFLKPPPIAADRPQGCALAPGPQASPRHHTCMQDPRRSPPWGGHLANSQIPPSRLIQAGIPLAQGQIALPAPPSEMSPLFPCVPPHSCQRTHLSPTPGDRPWVAIPSCPLLASSTQFSVFQLWLWRVSGMKQTKNQTRYMQYLSVYICRSSSAIRSPVKEASGAGTVGETPCHRLLSWWLAMLLSFPHILFSHVPFFFLIPIYSAFNSTKGETVADA